MEMTRDVINRDVRRVIALARRRGATVIVTSREHFTSKRGQDTWCDCPFAYGLAIDTSTSHVWLDESVAAQLEYAGYLIHELAHLHAPTRRENVRRANEWSWFGWEIAVAREIHVMYAWSCSMANYSIPPSSDEWDQFTTKGQREIIRERVTHAQKIGVVDRRGRAIWRRVQPQGDSRRIAGSKP
jgi:hypothetical protein